MKNEVILGTLCKRKDDTANFYYMRHYVAKTPKNKPILWGL